MAALVTTLGCGSTIEEEEPSENSLATDHIVQEPIEHTVEEHKNDLGSGKIAEVLVKGLSVEGRSAERETSLGKKALRGRVVV
jgi:hypothetical protein